VLRKMPGTKNHLTEEKRNLRNGIFIICNLQHKSLHHQPKEYPKAGNMECTIHMRNAYKILTENPEGLGLL
jgi:hypothetical protein